MMSGVVSYFLQIHVKSMLLRESNVNNLRKSRKGSTLVDSNCWLWIATVMPALRSSQTATAKKWVTPKRAQADS
jgi:hypothetical protein